MLDSISKQKLYGVIHGDWIFALYPDEKSYIPVIQNLKTGAWSDNFHSDFSQSTPAKDLYKQLKAFYGSRLFLPFPP